jgi:hypothetical protein
MPSNFPIFPASLDSAQASIRAANGNGIANSVTIRQGSINGDKIESLAVTSTDTNPVVLTFMFNTNPVGSVNIPANAGTDAAATSSVDVLGTTSMLPWVRTDSNARPYIYCTNGYLFQAYSQTTVTSGKVITLFAQLGVF